MRARLKIGDVFSIPLDADRVGYGQIVSTFVNNSYLLVIFSEIRPKGGDNNVCEIVEHSDIDLVGLSFDAKIKCGDWTVVGNCNLRGDVPFPAYKEVVTSPDRVEAVDFSGTRRRPATETESKKLPYRKFIAPVRLENAFRAIHGLNAWNDDYDPLVPTQITTSSELFGP